MKSEKDESVLQFSHPGIGPNVSNEDNFADSLLKKRPKNFSKKRKTFTWIAGLSCQPPILSNDFSAQLSSHTTI